MEDNKNKANLKISINEGKEMSIQNWSKNVYKQMDYSNEMIIFYEMTITARLEKDFLIVEKAFKNREKLDIKIFNGKVYEFIFKDVAIENCSIGDTDPNYKPFLNFSFRTKKDEFRLF